MMLPLREQAHATVAGRQDSREAGSQTESKVTLAVGADIRHEHLSATVLRMRATYNLALASRNIFIHRPKRNSVTVSRDSFD